jgi:hypothetical protein
LNADARSGVSLRVCVDEQNTTAPRGDDRCEINGGGGLPDPAFLIGDGYRLSHGWR